MWVQTPIVHIFSTCLGVVNLMEKLVFHNLFVNAQTKPATSRPMINIGSLPSSAAHPPTQKADTPGGGGGGTCIFPKIRGKPDKPTPPPPPSVPPHRIVSTSKGLVVTLIGGHFSPSILTGLPGS